MAYFVSSVISHYIPSHYMCPAISRIQAGAWTLFCVRKNSNTASVTRIRRVCYPRMYPTLMVYPDGSTVNIRYKEPRGIIKMPVNFSKLTEAEKKKVLANRKPKQKLEVIEEYSDTVDLSEYSKFFTK